MYKDRVDIYRTQRKLKVNGWMEKNEFELELMSWCLRNFQNKEFSFLVRSEGFILWFFQQNLGLTLRDVWGSLVLKHVNKKRSE